MKQDSGTFYGCSRNFPTGNPVTFIGEYPGGLAILIIRPSLMI